MIATLVHPGTAPSRRWAALPCTAQPVDLILPVADTLAQSVALALADSDGGWLEIDMATLANLDFVVPGNDPTGQHAAWYAGPHHMGAGTITHLGLFAARKQGTSWLHGHGSFAAPGWKGPDFGHILPLDSRLDTPTRARGWALSGAAFEVQTDAETGFPLNQPVAKGGGRGAAVITLRPNQDMSTALVAAAAEAGITQGRVYGLGSVVHPHLIGQDPIDSYATELLLTGGQIRNGTADLDVELVTLSGTRHSGRLEPGKNGICITAELLVVAD